MKVFFASLDFNSNLLSEYDCKERCSMCRVREKYNFKTRRLYHLDWMLTLVIRTEAKQNKIEKTQFKKKIVVAIQ